MTFRKLKGLKNYLGKSNMSDSSLCQRLVDVWNKIKNLPSEGKLHTVTFNGFATANLEFVGHALITDRIIRLTQPTSYQTGAVWMKDKIRIENGLKTTFTFKITVNGADGFAFVIQDDSPTALGRTGFELGYAGIKKRLLAVL